MSTEYLKPQDAPFDIVARAASLVAHELSEQAPDRAIGHHTSLVMTRNSEGDLAPALSVILIGPGLQFPEQVMTTLTFPDLCPPPEAFAGIVTQGLDELAKAVAPR